jgi:hypothetical protein
MDVTTSRAMPIRLDPQMGMMGGAYVPPRLVPQLHELLETRFDRTVRRLVEAEYDPLVILGPVYEALDAFGPDGQGMHGMKVIMPDPKRVDKSLQQRIEFARKEPRNVGFLARLMGRNAEPRQIMSNGHLPKE